MEWKQIAAWKLWNLMAWSISISLVCPSQTKLLWRWRLTLSLLFCFIFLIRYTQSDSLKEALNELDWSSDTLTVLLSPDPPYFRLTTSGPSGSCQVFLRSHSPPLSLSNFLFLSLHRLTTQETQRLSKGLNAHKHSPSSTHTPHSPPPLPTTQHNTTLTLSSTCSVIAWSW